MKKIEISTTDDNQVNIEEVIDDLENAASDLQHYVIPTVDRFGDQVDKWLCNELHVRLIQHYEMLKMDMSDDDEKPN